ncbi:3-isopropylmalate dehydratase large subunit [Pandoraea eparura]|jgi:3-isopropylmalate/(R)-2-methylmalate dehydratase large subunit|uniref:3-isopropylmalate dehydratase large subunit n=1 Tax=Pandoraea eparura TaxID=2508291 RepID=A0A5E4TEN3_9BURK|nr:aconitase family protein [Pandoraea eparura]VVD86626.1 3-isopropylmalate dehydratase large subunit [Pandoraea eparura]
MTELHIPGRILFLSDDPDTIDAQLQGRALTLAQAGSMRNDVSTDEITPIPVLTYYDDRLGRYPYVGLKAGDRTPIGTDSVKLGGFSVTVAGKRYGKGSSREHSPVAERRAGIVLVIAESFERIYRQNADNVGLFTSTDFGLIDRIQRGEAIDIEELVAPRDTLAAAILRHGGLLKYGQARMRDVRPSAMANTSPRPQTLAEKILSRHLVVTDDVDGGLQSGAGGFVKADWRFIHEYYTGMCAHMLHAAFGRPTVLHEPQSIIAFEDHLSYSNRSPVHGKDGLMTGVYHLSSAHRDFVREYGIRNHGYLGDADVAHGKGSEGISHAVMAESYALPGQVLVGTDSHTPHSGAVGCVAFGVGTTDMANSMVTGAVRLTVPESLRIDLVGRIPAGVTAKDIVLDLLAQPRIKAGAGVGRVFEFAGEAIRQLSTDERATLTNMTAELGGFTGIVAPDEETVRFLRERRGVTFVIEDWMHSDEGAVYAEVIRIDCSVVVPMVARPGDPGNGVPITDVTEGPIRFDIAYGGSCTAGKREDFDEYHSVLSWAAARGLKVPSHVKLYLQFGTVAVRDYCERRGYLEAFEAVGAELLQPACGACANCGPGSSTHADQVTISAINRNFPGRSGPGKVWLASPPTVAASAIAGELVSFEELQRRFGNRASDAQC